jgi:hypothetical protein
MLKIARISYYYVTYLPLSGRALGKKRRAHEEPNRLTLVYNNFLDYLVSLIIPYCDR